MLTCDEPLVEQRCDRPLAPELRLVGGPREVVARDAGRAGVLDRAHCKLLLRCLEARVRHGRRIHGVLVQYALELWLRHDAALDGVRVVEVPLRVVRVLVDRHPLIAPGRSPEVGLRHRSLAL